VSRQAADRIITARLTGAARRHANAWWRAGDVDRADHDAAVAELRELAAGRADLLAEVAGTVLGFSQGDHLFELRDAMCSQLCVDASADQALIPQWIAEGRRRREQAELRTPPRHTGELPGPG
jgi:hypothetical protein